ncbi:hypothetical protein [Brachybacterium sp. GCM10030252]|uniref:hypothetical protein n=1 Tax=Brachybacterium sp. GCM10030252 TaxID=3273380 RepID=UPI0036132737
MPTSETRAADAPSSQVDRGRRVAPIRRAPWTIDLLASVMAGAGLFGFWGGAGDIVGAAQGLGILMLAAGASSWGAFMPSTTDPDRPGPFTVRAQCSAPASPSRPWRSS